MALAVAIAMAFATSSEPERAANEPTGEVGPMGGAVIEMPGTVTGVARAGGVTVDGARFEMGRVPLMRTVTPTWRLHNTTREVITLGEPTATVVTGCCPGPLTLDMKAVPPGGHATLTFPLQMHPGMDGEHDFQLTVPVGADAEPLILGVTGDFR